MNDAELSKLFQESLETERWPEPPPDPAAIWWRARAADLLAEELRQRERRTRPLAAARSLAGLAALLAAGLGVLGGYLELPAEAGKAFAAAGLSPGTAALLALAALPTGALLVHLRLVSRRWV
jgi:hypothetical protein